MDQNVDRILSDAAHLTDGLRRGGVGVWRWKIGTNELRWTDNLEAVHAMPPGAFDGSLESFRRDLHPDDAEEVWHAISVAIETGNAYRVVYRSVGTGDGGMRWIEASGGVIRDDGGAAYLTGMCFDVTSRVRNEAELARRLRQQRGVQQLSSFALGAATFAEVLERTVRIAGEIFDVPLTKVLQFADSADHLSLVSGIGWRKGLVGQASVGIDLDSQAGYTLMSTTPVVVVDLATEARFSGPALLHEHGVRSGMSVVIAGSGERPFGVFGVHATDVRSFDANDVETLVSLANIVAQSARQHEAAEQKRLLLREMAHRTGNLLQVVASIASQTFRLHTDREMALQSFASRLDSLSRANHLITRSGLGHTRWISLVGEVLDAYNSQVHLDGRDIRIPPDLAFDLSLVLHELATNSAKYGGLSEPDGEVRLSWGLETASDSSRCLMLDWKDSRTGAVRSHGTGFGSKLKRAIIERKWNGTITISTEGPYHFTCRIPLDLSAVAD